jgi:hypothetical protein
LLDNKYPKHPDLSDQNARVQAVKPQELAIVLDTVDHAAQDKIGRYEVPRANIPTVRKIANPLKIGEMHEAAFVLIQEWPSVINRKSGPEPQATVRQLRRWIGEEQPGLPEQVQNLIIACYAIQVDKAWVRGGRTIQAPKLGNITDDMELRGQELPSAEEFQCACDRAAGVFRIARESVRSARSVHSLAEKVRRNAAGRLQPVQSLANELDRHAVTLGLDDEQPRMVTAKSLAPMLAALAQTTEDTDTLRLLASVELPKDNAIYLAHLENTESLSGALRATGWRVLDEFAGKQDDAEAAAIISVLRQNARRDEHEVSLAGPLGKAGEDALSLLLDRIRKPNPAPGADANPEPPKPTTIAALTSASRSAQPVIRVRGHEVAGQLRRISETADANPNAEFEITWRVVSS